MVAGLAYAASSIGLAKGDVLIKDTITKLAPGVKEHEVISNVEAGDDQKIDYLCEVDLSSAKIVAGYGDSWSADEWELVSTTKQARAYEKKTGETVVAAINADFFNMATGEPMGALVMGGEVKHAANGRPYFAITKDGKAVIRDGGVSLDDCEAAVGGDQIIVKDGAIQSTGTEYGALDYSRTAIGIREDGTVLTFTTYGRLFPISCGRTYQEIAEMMLDSGCTNVLTLDGGGSSTYCGRPEGSSELVVRNSPSDGAERQVSSTLLVVSTAKSTGEFDHAALTPNNEVYTPGSEVQFEAKGVDSAGAPVELPSGLEWKLSEESANLGSIDASTGVFTANDNTGVVEVQLVDGSEVVGSTSIEVATPDHIYFASEEISLGFEQTSDLGLVVRSNGRDINYKEGDIVWASTNEEMGSFEGNLFISSDGKTLNGEVKAASAWDHSVSGTIKVIVGMLPTTVWDFEDVTDEETGEVTSAEAYYVGQDGNAGILSTSNYGRGGKQSIEIASLDNDDPVRFGGHSLKLNYDFTQCGAVTEGACLGTTDKLSIPGTPTGIGVWVYAPEGVGITYEGPGSQAGFWLRGYVRDSAGNNMPYDFTLEPKACVGADGQWNGAQPGIHWEGWMYCEADLTSMSAPFSIQPGMTFRLMYVAGTGMGTKTAGSIYFDNLQFVYGANVDDVDSPKVSSFTANGSELKDGATLETNTVSFEGMYEDVQNKYTSGIDPETIRMYVDGKNVAGNDAYEFAVDPDGSRSQLNNVSLQNGEHSVTVAVRDKFGNETTATREFAVAGEGIEGLPSVKLTSKSESAVLGEVVSLELRATDNASLDEVAASVKLNNQFKECEVEFAEAYEGTFEYKAKSDTVGLSAELKEGAESSDGLIATIKVKVPSTLAKSAKFTYEVKSGSYFYDAVAQTFYLSKKSLDIVAPLSIECAPVIQGREASIAVSDLSGNPVADASVVCVKDGGEEELGKTDESGVLKTSALSESAASYTVYASKIEGEKTLVSFQETIGVYSVQGDESGKPFGILNNAAKDATSQKNVSWMSCPASSEQQVLQYAPAGSDEWTTIEATTSLQTFSKGGHSMVNTNNAVIDGLDSGTEYKYRVGFEGNWSDEVSFTTLKEHENPSFFLLGDIQTDDHTNVTALASMIKAKSFDFGIQTGDLVDDTTAFADWENVVGLFGSESIGAADAVHVLGNHEFAGDENGQKASDFFGVPTTGMGGTYSVTYGNVYVASISYTGNTTQLENALAWLKEDAAKSRATWKVLAIHQPAYYTNTVGGNAEIHSLVPPVVDECGIDFVFSGHDHSYARTMPMTGGKVDEQNGAVYYICGSAGEKSYTVTINDEFNFAKTSDSYEAIYMGVVASDDSMKVTTYDLDGSVIDEYTMEKVNQCEAGHTMMRSAEDGSLFCSVCNKSFKKYTGFATDEESGKTLYYLNGAMQTGWVSYGTERLHFGEDGFQHEVKCNHKPTTCIVRGSYTYTCSCGATDVVKDDAAPGHEYVEQEDGSHKCSVCDWTRIELEDCKVTMPYTAVTYTGEPRELKPTIVAPTGKKLAEGYNYRLTYTGGVDVGKVTVTAKAMTVGIYIDINEFRGNYGGTVTKTYWIRPPQATGLEAGKLTAEGSVLTWNGAEQVDSYRIFQSTDAGKNWTQIGETNDTQFALDNLKAKKNYQFKVRSVKVANGYTYTSIKDSNVAKLSTAKMPVASDYKVALAKDSYFFTGKDIKPAVTVKEAASGKVLSSSNYVVTYSNNRNAGTAKASVEITTSTGKVTINKTFVIKKLTVGYGTIELSKASYVYDGTRHKPAVKVYNSLGTQLAQGKNYTVAYRNNLNAGKATVVVTGVGNYTGTLTKAFTIKAKDIASCDVKQAYSKAVYNGVRKTPKVTVAAEDGTVLTQGTHYTVTRTNNLNPGKATVVVAGKGNYRGSVEMSIVISKGKISKSTVTLAVTTVKYDGKYHKPAVTVVSSGGKQLIKGEDFKVTYRNNKNVGTAYAVVTGIGKYEGTTEVPFKIVRK